MAMLTTELSGLQRSLKGWLDGKYFDETYRELRNENTIPVVHSALKILSNERLTQILKRIDSDILKKVYFILKGRNDGATEEFIKAVANNRVMRGYEVVHWLIKMMTDRMTGAEDLTELLATSIKEASFLSPTTAEEKEPERVVSEITGKLKERVKQVLLANKVEEQSVLTAAYGAIDFCFSDIHIMPTPERQRRPTELLVRRIDSLSAGAPLEVIRLAASLTADDYENLKNQYPHKLRKLGVKFTERPRGPRTKSGYHRIATARAWSLLEKNEPSKLREDIEDMLTTDIVDALEYLAERGGEEWEKAVRAYIEGASCAEYDELMGQLKWATVRALFTSPREEEENALEIILHVEKLYKTFNLDPVERMYWFERASKIIECCTLGKDRAKKRLNELELLLTPYRRTDKAALKITDPELPIINSAQLRDNYAEEVSY